MAKKLQKAPLPLLGPNQPVDWWFMFKFNAQEEPGDPKSLEGSGIFDDKQLKQRTHKGYRAPTYESDGKKFSENYAFASSKSPVLQHGKGIAGATVKDPLGATFAQVYNGSYYYVIWNDQFYLDPRPNGDEPWGHSKGMVAWNEDGEGFVMQVSTPSWPASGNSKYPRQTDGNTLGYVSDDDIEVSQHFFALKLSKADLLEVLAAMNNAAVVTGVRSKAAWEKGLLSKMKKTKTQPAITPQPPLPPPPDLKQVVNNGGPADIQKLVNALLTVKPGKGTCTKVKLSTGVTLISKPSNIAAPPWQLVSAQLGGVDLRVATWWANPKIYSTTKASPTPRCWDEGLGKPGAVEIATTGSWHQKNEPLGFQGISGPEGNHAKFGVSTTPGKTLSIFGDMNQQGSLGPVESKHGLICSSSQNGRGGLFFVVDDKKLFQSLTSLLEGESAGTEEPPKKAAKKRQAKKAKPKAKPKAKK